MGMKKFTLHKNSGLNLFLHLFHDNMSHSLGDEDIGGYSPPMNITRCSSGYKGTRYPQHVHVHNSTLFFKKVFCLLIPRQNTCTLTSHFSKENVMPYTPTMKPQPSHPRCPGDLKKKLWPKLQMSLTEHLAN